jgi:hypothetical protein
MRIDPIESIALIPNPTDNFDEVWMIVNRLNGRFVERMTRRLRQSDCGGQTIILDEQVFMDSAVSYEDSVLITAVSIGIGPVYRITSPSHGFSNGDTVSLRNVSGALYLSGTKWVIGSVTPNTFTLVTQVT